MARHCTLLSSFFLLHGVCEAQSGWTLLNPLPTTRSLYSVRFVDLNVGYAVGSEGAVLKSTDGGISWNSHSIGRQYSLRDLHFIDRNRGWVLERRWTYGWRFQILRTVDGGVGWTVQVDTIGSLSSIYFVDENIGWAVGDMPPEWSGTVFKTTNGGNNWLVQTTGLHDYLGQVFFLDRRVGWIVGGGGTILKTTNGGDSWSLQTSGTSINLHSVCLIDSAIGWTVGTYSRGLGDYWSTVFKTTDGGATWFQQLNIAGEFPSLSFASAMNGCAAGDGVIRTTDGGNNWSGYNIGSWLNSITMLNSSVGWTVGDNGKLYKTETGGTTWTALHRDFVNSDLYGVDFVDDSKGWIVGTGASLRTGNGGQTWIPMSLGWGYPEAVDFVNDRHGWVVGVGGIKHTTDGGVTWITQHNNPRFRFRHVAFVGEHSGWVVGDWGDAGDSASILHTSNGGMNWEEQYRIRDGTLQYVDFVEPLEGWAVGWWSGHGAVFHTSDGGVHWQPRCNSIEGPLTSVDFVDRLRGWGTMSWPQTGGLSLLKTSDGGLTWMTVQGISSSVSLGCVDFVDSLNGWVGGYPTIWCTTDGGMSWTDQDSPAGCSHVCMVDANTGFAVGQQGVILRTTTGGFTSVHEAIVEPRLSSGYSLSQNYPNPFNPSTHIQFSIVDPQLTILKVYDVLGQEVATLVNEVKRPGRYTVQFVGSGLASGVYFCRMQAGDFVTTRKLVVVR